MLFLFQVGDSLVPSPCFHSNFRFEGEIGPGDIGGQDRRLPLHHNSRDIRRVITCFIMAAAQPTTESDQMELAMAAIWRCNCVSSFVLTLNGKVSLQQCGADQLPRQLLLCEPFCNLISATPFCAAIVNGFDPPPPPPMSPGPIFSPRTKVGMEIRAGYEARLVKPVQGYISACCPLCTVHQSL